MNDNITGGAYKGPETQAATIWKCPGCGIENTSRFESGCPACGAGRPGYKKEVVEDPGLPDPIYQNQHTKASDADAAFETWVTPRLLAIPREDLQTLLRAAFRAGIAYAMNTGIPVAMPGTKETRTLAAALSRFIDQVLIGAEEEIENGEWLSVVDAQKLLKQLEGTR